MSWYIQRALRQSLVSWILRWILPHRVLFFDWLNPFSQVSSSLDRRSFKAWHRHTHRRRGWMDVWKRILPSVIPVYSRVSLFRETELNVLTECFRWRRERKPSRRGFLSLSVGMTETFFLLKVVVIVSGKYNIPSHAILPFHLFHFWERKETWHGM